MKGRTVREFPCPGDLWGQVEIWAAETGFNLVCQEDRRRVYRKGHWLLMAPARVEIRQEGQQVILEAWVKADFFLFSNILSSKKPETGLEAGGLTAALPRQRARVAFNRLLARFDQQRVT